MSTSADDDAPAASSGDSGAQPGAAEESPQDTGEQQGGVVDRPYDEYLLVADGVVAGYVPEVNILTGCSLTLHQGEVVAIIGPNGAGKSTLVKTVFGLIPVRSGELVLHGSSIRGLTAHELVEHGVGYVPQTQNVFPSLTIEENLEMGAFVRPDLVKSRFEVVAGLFPLLGRRRRAKAGSLSGGERQMVAMGRALMMDPHVLLLDEPTAGLSPMYQDEVFQRVKEINSIGVSIVMVEQNARRCLQISDRGYVLDQGRNAYTGTGTELLQDPNVIELYLGSLASA